MIRILNRPDQIVYPGRARALLVALLIALLGAGLSVAAGTLVSGQQRHLAEQAIDQRTALVTEVVKAETGRYVDTLRTVAAAAGAFTPLTKAAFTQAVTPLEQTRLAGATSIAFMVPATDEQIPAVQARWRSRGASGLVLDAKGSGHEHVFSIFSHPLDGSTAPATGIDATQAAAPAHALTESRRSGQVTVSDTYQLIRDTHLPASQRQLSFVLTAPVYGPAAVDGRRPFVGWVLMGLRGQDFIGATLRTITQDAADVRLRAAHSDATTATVAILRATAAGVRDLHRTRAVRVAQRSWQLDIDATSRHLPGARTPLGAITTGIGIALSVLLAMLVFALGSGRMRARAAVAAATAELRAAETDARRQSGLLTAVLDSVGDGVGVVDATGAFLLHNPAAKSMLGTGADTGDIATWQRHYGIFTPDGAAPFATGDLPLVRALAGEIVEQVPLLIRNATHPDGRIISVSARPLDAASGQAGAVAVFRDVTAAVRAEQQLAATAAALQAEVARHEADQAALRAARDELAVSKAYLTQVLDAIDVTVITCDADGTIVHANRVARTALPAGDRPLTITETTPRLGLTHPDGTPMTVEETPLARALRGEAVDDLEATVTPPGQPKRIIMLHARPLHHPDGRIVGAVASSFNITALREREAELQAFAGSVAHDLQRPLTVVRGFTELVRDDLVEQTGPTGHGVAGGAVAPARTVQLEQVRHLDRVLAATARMTRLIDDLLTYAVARDGAVTLRPVDLHDLAADVMAGHLAAAAADLASPIPQIYLGPLPSVCADAPLVRQLLDNLIANAIKYTPPGQAARVDVTAHPAASGWVRVEVADRGIGIPSGEHQAIFAGFHRATTAYAGTGLGLAICQRIVARHGGTITAGDNPGGGARFAFTLPAAPIRP
ncbi:ATP-binding protein [Planomonospora sphaerica]|uniref:ATP-binding protein n=1 Tax=Planomonospora sphaerica TaxID=161355 RepID=UPI0012906A9A|nr:ATP-binding protein [Planomonospora sphaerica]